MKRKIAAILALALALVLALASCSKVSMATDTEQNGAYWGGDKDMSASAPESSGTGGDWSEDSWNDVVGATGDAINPTPSMTEKMIYTADVDVETVDFDAAVDSVEAMLERFGAFLESSSVSGRSYSDSYYGYQTYRRAYFTIRVPVSSFVQLRDGLEDVGNVVSKNTYAENITVQYYDTESRAQSYRIEQERLMAMLEKCETVTEMIEIESRLSEVRYQLESLESTLRNWQNQVDYSTVNVTIREVEEYTRPVEIHRTYWQQIGDGLQNTFESIGDFFKSLFKWLVVNLPVILVAAVFIGAALVALIAIIRGGRRRSARKNSAVEAEYTETDNTDKKE